MFRHMERKPKADSGEQRGEGVDAPLKKLYHHHSTNGPARFSLHIICSVLFLKSIRDDHKAIRRGGEGKEASERGE